MENSKIIERDIEKDIQKWLFSKEIIAIRGPRQSGKTTLLNKIKQRLMKKSISENQITNITFEDEIEKNKFQKNPQEYLEYFISEKNKKHYFLLDEVQYIENAGKLLKLVYDKTSNIKIFITGSSTLEITEVGSYLVGRVLFFDLRTFSFSEFLKARDINAFNYYNKNKISIKDLRKDLGNKQNLFLDTLNKYLEEYLIFGGYPRVVLEKNNEKKIVLLKNLFLTYIEKDILKLYGTKYKQPVLDLLDYLANCNGEIINYNEVCNITGLYLKELKQVMKILEETYVIKIIKPYHKNLATELKKNPRVYFFDLGLRNYKVNRFQFNDEEKGKLLENFILNTFHYKKSNYWRTTSKAEVDFVFSDSYNKLLPIEVKFTPKITRALRSFIHSYNPEIAIIANIQSLKKQEKINKTEVFFLPASLL
ncbi:MAG: ATP-binding protein [Nanoarchaeota archaeon]